MDYKQGRGRKGHLQEEHCNALLEWIEENNNITLRELVIKIESKFQISTSQSAINRVLKKLNFSYITPRPIHNKQDSSTHTAFKKNLQREMDGHPGRTLYFFDESRFGTHSNLGHGWFEKGKRSRVEVKLGFQNFYVYSAVSPSSGDSFSLLASSVDTDIMNIYLDKLSKHLGEKTALVVMDGASWHRSKALKVSKNISTLLLPPYSPELNPVERLWHYVKSKLIRNKIYNNLSDLEESVCAFLCGLNNKLIQSICSFDYLN